MASTFAKISRSPRPAALGTFWSGPRGYGALAAPTRPGRRTGVAWTPAVTGFFRAGKAVGISQINAMATNVPRGSG
jgi:hypothetical protein